MTPQNSTKSDPRQTHQPNDDQIESRNPSLKIHDKSINNQSDPQSPSLKTQTRPSEEEEETALQSQSSPTPVNATKEPILSEALAEENGRERLKRHRVEVAGQVWIPDMWGQEELLKDWIDCSAFDASLVPRGIMSARASLVEEGRRANSGGLRIENRC